MQSYKESEIRRSERIQNIKRLRTQVVESKKVYNRKRNKDSLRKNKEII